MYNDPITIAKDICKRNDRFERFHCYLMESNEINLRFLFCPQKRAWIEETRVGLGFSTYLIEIGKKRGRGERERWDKVKWVDPSYS